MKECIFVFTFIWLLSQSLAAADTRLKREAVFGMAQGYIEDVDSEVPSKPEEILMMEKPKILEGPSVHQRLFNDELSNEFMFQYQQKFGRTEFEENYFLMNQQGYTITPGGLTRTEEDTERRKFAEYMMRRLTEFHTENIMKTDPQFKRVYEIKQTISNVKMEINPQTRVDMNYSFVGNFAKFRVTNPTANMIVLINMQPAAVTPTSPDEVDARITHSFTRTVEGEVGYLFITRNARIALMKRLSEEVLLTLSQTSPMAGSGNIETDREALSLVALGARF